MGIVMAKPTPSFLFHIPHRRDVINAEQLEKKMNARYPPEVVGVIDTTTHKQLGSMHPTIALMKFR